MLPIPRRLLIHSADIKTPVSEDCFGVKTYSESVALKFIRIEYTETDKARERDMLNMEKGGSAVLIYDCSSSLPKNFIFKTGQETTFEGKKLRVTDVSKLYDESRLHHIEAELTEVGE